MNRYECGATIDIGPNRESQEDFVQFKELDDDSILCLIADGSGSRSEYPKPAPIVCMNIIEQIYRLYNADQELFMQNPCLLLKESFLQANKLIGAFKIASEELFYGYASSVTALLLTKGQRFFVAHCGSTRLWVLREGDLRQLTTDHTKAMELLREGVIDKDTYHVHPDRLVLTSGLGVFAEPEIQTLKGKFRQNDMFILTSDGVHYAIRPEYISKIILDSTASCEAATYNLIMAARDVSKYPDNMSAMIVIEKNQG